MKIITIKEWSGSVLKTARVTWRVVKDVWPENQWPITIISSIAIYAACSSYFIYWLYGKLIGSLTQHEPWRQSLMFVVAVLLVSFVSDLSGVLEGLMERKFHHRLQTRLNMLYFHRKSGISIATLENPDFRDVVSRAQDNFLFPIMNIAESMFMHLSNIIRLAVALAIVGMYDWKLCLVVCVALVPQFVVDVRHGSMLWGIFDAETDTRRKFSESRRHFLSRSNLVELKMFQGVEHFLNRLHTFLKAFQESQEEVEKKRYMYSALSASFSALLIGFVIVVVVIRVTQGLTPVASFVFVWGSLQSLHGALSGTIRTIAKSNEQALFANDNYAVIDAQQETSVRRGTITCANRVPEIRFENVSFSYPWDDPKKLILKDVSLTIRPNERVGLVGINGAGKTTLVKLLCGIYSPTRGKILIDGVDMELLDSESWKRQVAVLLQNYTLHQVPVREAIALGDTKVPIDDERVREAAIASGAATFIEDLRLGYHTMLGKDFEDGVELSGGQNQRLALAKVFYRKGKVVVLDEPTASLDAFVEAQIFDDLRARPRMETMILITHRLSSVRSLDRVIVLDRGSVAEDGNHKQLMSKGGIYADMFNRQALGYSIEPTEPGSEE